MAGLWNSEQRDAIAAAMDDLVPGASHLGAVDYVENLLTALDHEPPRIWAGPQGWLDVGPWERHAWATRIAELARGLRTGRAWRDGARRLAGAARACV